MTPIQSGPDIQNEVESFFANERPFGALEEYWRDPKPFEDEEAANRARAHAAIDAGMRKFWENRK